MRDRGAFLLGNQPELLLLLSLAIIQFCFMQLWTHHALEQQRQSDIYFQTLDPVFHYAYRSPNELNRHRFPSVEERIQAYMTSWYAPPRRERDYIHYRYLPNGTTLIRTLNPDGKDESGALVMKVDKNPIRSRQLFLLDAEEMLQCTEKLCKDVVMYILPAITRLRNRGVELTAPLIMQFGDAEEWHASNGKHNEPYPNVPLVKKFRTALPKNVVTETTRQVGHAVDFQHESDRHTQAIVWIVCNFERHFGPLREIPSIDTIPWSEKKKKAVWRGSLTGRNHLPKKHTHNAPKVCELIPRCQFVYRHRTSSWVDARLVRSNDFALPVPDQINGFDLFASERLGMAQLLEYRIIVIIEGNDVSTGLKWALFSESIVLMPPPQYTSWAMEERLEPWVHYVPIEQVDFSDVEDKVQWILHHDLEAQTIIKNARLWIADLIFHPQAEQERDYILEEILRRYQTHFREDPDL